MKKMIRLLAAMVLAYVALGTAQAGSLGIDLAAAPANPAQPTMGDWLHFKSTVTNAGDQPVQGLVAWISLVEVTKGHEQPMDLEDWSAHKAVTGAQLAPGARLETDWPLRLIQAGDYRVVISATDRDNRTVYTSPTYQFHITPKPVVESARLLPVAIGIPLLIGGMIGYRGWRSKTAQQESEGLKRE